MYIESSNSTFVGYINANSEIIYSSKPTVIHRVFYI